MDEQRLKGVEERAVLLLAKHDAQVSGGYANLSAQSLRDTIDLLAALRAAESRAAIAEGDRDVFAAQLREVEAERDRLRAFAERIACSCPNGGDMRRHTLQCLWVLAYEALTGELPALGRG